MPLIFRNTGGNTMQRKIISVLLIFAFVAAIAGCGGTAGQTVSDNKGAAVGATLGATAGVLLGGSTGGRIAGGLIGALVGGAIGHYAYDKKRSADETAQTYNYKSSQGSVVSIENASSSPTQVRSGDTVEIAITYAVLNPSPSVETRITEVREITHEGKLVGRPEHTVSRTAGTYTSTIPLTLPNNSDPGTYEVKTIIETPEAKDVRYTKFTVL
jgi:hypothetical protein